MPAGTGLIADGGGWVEALPGNITNATAPLTVYTVLEAAVLDVASPLPRVYKQITYRPDGQGGAVADITTLPVYTMIVSMADGVVTDIGWDDGCFFCAENGDDCVKSALNATTSTLIDSDTFVGCRSTADTCYPPARPLPNATAGDGGNSTGNATLTLSPCDLKVFVTWTGTDKNGQYLTSAGQRFSRYRAFGIATMYQSALNLVQDGINIGQSAINSVQEWPGQILPANSGDDGGG